MQNINKPALWIVGDSFSYINEHDLCRETWPLLLQSTLEYDLNSYSIPGVSQDWVWRKIRDWQFSIQPEDQLVIVLTHPSRFWFFEDRPDCSNHNIVDFDKIIDDQEKVNAVKYFIQYIQRPELDIQATDHRMGWLSNLVYRNNWKKPLIIQAFAQTIYTDLYPNLIFSEGNLFAVSKEEETGNIKDKNWDCRYNHLCLSNHKILADKIIKSMTDGSNLDLMSGFIKGIYDGALFDKTDQTELSPKQVEGYNSRAGATESWLTRRFKSK